MVQKKIAFIAVGDELTQGDILNTNSQQIAHILHENNFSIGQHLIVADDKKDIACALRYALQQHSAVIVIGGLGPTQDDLTRFAAAELINEPLIFSEAVWQTICNRVKKHNHFISENNKQQALFPPSATIIPNPHGTAAGFTLNWQEKFIVFLPGPPQECLPLFKQDILAKLQCLMPPATCYRQKWRLFSVSESFISSQIETLLQEESVQIGYRVDYPYLEVKLASHDESCFKQYCRKLQPLLKKYFLADPTLPATQVLYDYIKTLPFQISIDDQVTGGLLQTYLVTPATQKIISFQPKKSTQQQLHISISGLTGFWQANKNTDLSSLTLIYQSEKKLITHQHNIPQYLPKIITRASEVIANDIVTTLKKQFTS